MRLMDVTYAVCGNWQAGNNYMWLNKREKLRYYLVKLHHWHNVKWACLGCKLCALLCKLQLISDV